MAELLRRALLVRAAVEVLAEHTEPLPGGDVVAEVARRVELTAAEQATHSSGRQRYANFIQWASTWLRTAGWLDKTKQGWLLTPAGHEALCRYDPETFLKEAAKAYRRQYQAGDHHGGGWSDPRWQIVREAVDALPEGSWTAYKDLSDLVGIPPQSIGTFMSDAENVDAGYRVLSINGTISPDFRWNDPERDDDPHALLVAEGVRFDPGGHADQSQRLTAEDLRLLLAETGTEARAWLVRGSAVGGVNVTPQWFAHGFVSLAASHLRPVEAGATLDDLRSIVDADYGHLSYQARKAKVAELYAFLNRMRSGDAVITTSEGRARAGRINGDPYSSDGDSLMTLRRPVTWAEEDVDFTELPDALQARLKSSAVVVDLTEIADVVESLVGDTVAAPVAAVPREVVLPDLPRQVRDDLLVGSEWLDEFVDLLRARRQAILYGPPGTGKTYIALTVAEALTDPANVQLVQFHPSYSYEDFFEGYRPSPPDKEGRIGFDLASGPLREIADDASANPTVPYVLVIDEINRANLAKVFGELYFLLEYRERSVRLLYKREDDAAAFTLPKNLYIVGTMNTADRSIALVDAAMRRRFAFLSLHPDDAHVRGVLRAWLERRGLPLEPADLLDELNARVPDRDLKIGPSYLMRADEVTTEAGLRRIWRTAILPLLEEYHYGDTNVDVQGLYGLDALKAAVVARRPPPDLPAPDLPQTDASGEESP